MREHRRASMREMQNGGGSKWGAVHPPMAVLLSHGLPLISSVTSPGFRRPVDTHRHLR